MGIKHFFPWFKKMFPEYIHILNKYTSFVSLDIKIDNFMIDLNGVFHSSTQKIYEYGNHKPHPRLLGRKRRPNNLNKQIRVFEDVCKTIELLFQLIKPTKRFILCVDGCAPMSKQQQQRSRRFRSAVERQNNDQNAFDSNSLSPGTKFMDYLTKYIDWYIRKRITDDKEWQNVEVIFSNEKSHGEGEQKAISFIRNYGNNQESYCIHGMDADLIMYSMATQVRNMYILRDEVYIRDIDHHFIDIGSSREELNNILSWETDSYNHSQAIYDFVFICFTVGNDFLPHIPSLEIIEGGLEVLIDIYKNVCESYGHLTSKTRKGIYFNIKSLEIFLGTVGKHEKDMLERKLNGKNPFFEDIILNRNSVYSEEGSVVDIEKYKEDYYNTLFPGEDIESICHHYLEGMQWVILYYTKQVPNWKWFYPFHYAPFASDLAKHISTFIFPVYPQTVPNTPFQQLLHIMPPQSANLLPHPLSKLLTDEDSPLTQFCPAEIKIDLSGKRREWEGIVLLPIVDTSIVRSAYFSKIKQVDARDLKRNVYGKSFVYTYSSDTKFFRSYYGDIPDCPVRIQTIDL